ncbi:hypothetical protein J2N86_04470 [Legionella lytica]|uniref:Uncharacterized protein n=1 Tax=Legionella lytica TaxID=96232 RepID=A0ABY4YAA9_9GAMM|nr:hypothetical protein [Legionella lytica]USQ14574.1 hypothetical protein J2N86_04470 [Legionella lytica]
MNAKLEETLFCLHQSVLKKVSAIELTVANADLLKLLLELLCEENLLSHPNMPSLLYLLNQPELPMLISYIVDLDCVDASPTSPKGSFFAQAIINRQQASCVNLLRNVASVKNNDTRLWEDANGLLQNALLIYPCIHKQSNENTGYCIFC